MKHLLLTLTLVATSAVAGVDTPRMDCDQFAVAAKSAQEIRQTWFKNRGKDITRVEFKALIAKVAEDDTNAIAYFNAATPYVFNQPRSTPVAKVEAGAYPKCETANALMPIL